MDFLRKLHDMKNRRGEKLDAAAKALELGNMEDYQKQYGDATAMNGEIDALQNMIAEQGRFDETDPVMLNLAITNGKRKEDDLLRNAVDTARSGNEYVQAFCAAIRTKADPENSMGNEKLTPLYNAMTIGGGTPTGSEGGFLVPIDFDNMIHKKMKEFIRLADFFKVENVTGYTGWRAVETTAGRSALPEIDEAAPIGENDKPSFKKITYTVKKYGDRIAVSSELMSDNTAGLMQYLAEWFGPRVVMTENSLLLALLNKLTAKSFTGGKELAELKSALNKGLNTAISKNATLLCNQSSYDFMDGLTDTMGRGILVPNPADPDVYRFKGRPVISADNDLVPDRTVTTAGATKGDYYPIYIGCMSAYATMFRRQALEFASTSVGGSSWANATSEVRGIVRMDAQAVDETAAVKREIFIPAT